MKKKKSVGRPRKHDIELETRILFLLERGLSEEDCAFATGINPSTIQRWKKSDPEFCMAVRGAKETPDSQVATTLFQRIIGGLTITEKHVTKDGNGKILKETISTKELPPDVSGSMFWLKNRLPHLWRDREATPPEQSRPLPPLKHFVLNPSMFNALLKEEQKNLTRLEFYAIRKKLVEDEVTDEPSKSENIFDYLDADGQKLFKDIEAEALKRQAKIDEFREKLLAEAIAKEKQSKAEPLQAVEPSGDSLQGQDVKPQEPQPAPEPKAEPARAQEPLKEPAQEPERRRTATEDIGRVKRDTAPWRDSAFQPF